MHDRDMKLITKATRSKNRLYKVRMGLKESMCYIYTKTSDSSRWHARLGHINLDTIKSMITRELVTGIPNIDIEVKVWIMLTWEASETDIPKGNLIPSFQSPKAYTW